ncbi:HD domain-containing phosphohydrolase [Hahella ganghwensis]|uniref:HD domain-containing phosphohydrolase n=1 Tax=Hahella ganghwensis TaxID=286420 RepID=UPI00037FAE1D|nr:HD domain-containing phosphohydrolase [Hahella ganghwensis]
MHQTSSPSNHLEPETTVLSDAADDMEQVLFVDDEPGILSSLQRLLRKQNFRCHFAASGDEGLSILEQQRIDLVVSDMRMPGMDGAQFLATVRKRWPQTVRMLLTGHSDISATITALNEGGIYRYISKPWDGDELLEILEEGLRIRRLEREKKHLLQVTKEQNQELQEFNKNLEQMVEARTEELRQTADMLELSYQQLKDSYDAFVRVFSTFVTSRGMIRGHAQSVADLSRSIAQAMELPEVDVKHIYYAGLLHELGKLSLSDEILSRAEAKLNRKDIPEYVRYPVLGEMALMAIDELEPTAHLIRCHAEYLDGSGFPNKLKEEEIPLGARIIRVVRDFIGLQSGLMKTQPLDKDAAFDYILAAAGKKYDPAVVKCLQPLVAEYSPDRILPYERLLSSNALEPGMTLSRDLVNSNGILLFARGYKLTTNIIEKIILLEKSEQRRINVYIRKNTSGA